MRESDFIVEIWEGAKGGSNPPRPILPKRNRKGRIPCLHGRNVENQS